MKASYARRYGGPEVIEYGDLPEPRPAAEEIVVAVEAVSLNPLDTKIRRGDFRWVTGRRFPKLLGGDLAGVVEKVGPGVLGLSPGDRVYGFSPIYLRRPGALAERVAVAPKHVRSIPAGLSFEQAAALPVAALTALSGLRQCGDLGGRSVLIVGATGGVGHFAVQIAKARGARVTGVCSGRNVELARALGADKVIDYQTQDVTRLGRSYDVVFDTSGKLSFADSHTLLRRGGVYVTPLATPLVLLKARARSLWSGRRFVAASMRTKPEDYAAMEQLVRDQRLVPRVERVVALSEAREAFVALETGQVRGKVVVRIRPHERTDDPRTPA